MVAITEEAVLRRFHDLKNVSQEAIETVSLWIMHHKDKSSIETIVTAWEKAFKFAATDIQRTGLFYVMNDVVQRAKSKHIEAIIPAFQPAVLAAISAAKSSRDDGLRKAISRCIDIFGERGIFTTHSVNTMKNLFHSEESGDAEEGAVDVEIGEVYGGIQNFEKCREIIDRGMETIIMADFDFKSKISQRMRGKTEGAALIKEAEAALVQVTAFRKGLDVSKQKLLELLETMSLAKIYFSHQLKEVTVVEDAYQKFGQGIREVKDEVVEMKKTKSFPAATPPRDAPSPTANDDIYATGVEHAIEALRVPGMRDNNEAMDMEIGDDDDDVHPQHLTLNMPPPNHMPHMPASAPGMPFDFSSPPPMMPSQISPTGPAPWPPSTAMPPPLSFMPNVPPPSFAAAPPPPPMFMPPPAVPTPVAAAPKPDIQELLKSLSGLESAGKLSIPVTTIPSASSMSTQKSVIMPVTVSSMAVHHEQLVQQSVEPIVSYSSEQMVQQSIEPLVEPTIRLGGPPPSVGALPTATSAVNIPITEHLDQSMDSHAYYEGTSHETDAWQDYDARQFSQDDGNATGYVARPLSAGGYQNQGGGGGDYHHSMGDSAYSGGQPLPPGMEHDGYYQNAPHHQHYQPRGAFRGRRMSAGGSEPHHERGGWRGGPRGRSMRGDFQHRPDRGDYGGGRGGGYQRRQDGGGYGDRRGGGGGHYQQQQGGGGGYRGGRGYGGGGGRRY